MSPNTTIDSIDTLLLPFASTLLTISAYELTDNNKDSDVIIRKIFK